MANKVLFAYDNYLNSVAATLTSGSEDSNYPDDNVYERDCAKVFRTDDVASAYWLKNDFGSAQEVDFVAVLNHNFQAAASIKIQAHATDSWGAPSVDRDFDLTGITDNSEYNLFFKFPSVQNFRWWRLYIDDQTNPAGYNQVGEWFVGSYVEMTAGFDWPYRRSRKYKTIEHETYYGNKWVYARNSLQDYEVGWTNMPNAELSDLETTFDAIEGNRYPFIFVPNDSNTFCMYARAAGELDVTRRYLVNDINFAIREESRGLSS